MLDVRISVQFALTILYSSKIVQMLKLEIALDPMSAQKDSNGKMNKTENLVFQ